MKRIIVRDDDGAILAVVFVEQDGTVMVKEMNGVSIEID